MYDPTVGRWLSLDPIGFEGNDTNLYRYVGNEPTGFGDSMGLKKQKAIYKTPNEIADALNVRIHYSKDGTSIVKNSWRGGAPDIIVIGSHGYPIKKAKKVIKGCKCPTENHLDEISFDSGPEIFLVNYNAFIYSSFVHELIAGPLAYAVTGENEKYSILRSKSLQNDDYWHAVATYYELGAYISNSHFSRRRLPQLVNYISHRVMQAPNAKMKGNLIKLLEYIQRLDSQPECFDGRIFFKKNTWWVDEEMVISFTLNYDGDFLNGNFYIRYITY